MKTISLALAFSIILSFVPTHAQSTGFGALEIGEAEPFNAKTRIRAKSGNIGLAQFKLQTRENVSISSVSLKIENAPSRSIQIQSFYLQTEKDQSTRASLSSDSRLRLSFGNGYRLRANAIDTLYLFGRPTGNYPRDLDFTITDIQYEMIGRDNVFVRSQPNVFANQPVYAHNDRNENTLTTDKIRQINALHNLNQRSPYDPTTRVARPRTNPNLEPITRIQSNIQNPYFRYPRRNEASFSEQKRSGGSKSIQRFIENQDQQISIHSTLSSQPKTVMQANLKSSSEVDLGTFTIKNRTGQADHVRNFYFKNQGKVDLSRNFNTFQLINSRNGKVIHETTLISEDTVVFALPNFFRVGGSNSFQSFNIIGKTKSQTMIELEPASIQLKFETINNLPDNER